MATQATTGLSTNVEQVFAYHMLQLHETVQTLIAKVDYSPVVCYLGITGATAVGGRLTAVGQGKFAGPLKSSTDQDRKVLAESFPDYTTLPARLLDKSAPLLMLACVELNSGVHIFAMGLDPSPEKEKKQV